MAYRDLRQNKQATLEKYASAFNKKNEASNDDDRFWYPDIDKAGNGLSIIRFLPAPDGEDSPTVKIYKRSFKGPTGKWYIENDLGTIGQEDPVNDLNRKLVAGRDFQTIADEDPVKKRVREQKRKTNYIANIYVVKDQLHPENEGKVFLFNFGVKIHGMINEKMNPSFEGETRINPFDLEDGANLKIKIRKEDGKYRNYDKSEWEKPAPLFVTKAGEPDHDKLEAVYNQAYKLQPFLAPDQFKTREQLEARLAAVVGNTDRVQVTETVVPLTKKTAAKAEKPAWESEDDEIDPEMFDGLGLDE